MGHRSQTHCPHGHEFTPDNTLWVNRKSGARDRRCKACHQEGVKTWRAYKERDGARLLNRLRAGRR